MGKRREKCIVHIVVGITTQKKIITSLVRYLQEYKLHKGGKGGNFVPGFHAHQVAQAEPLKTQAMSQSQHPMTT